MIHIDFNRAAVLAVVLITAVSLLSQWRAFRRMRQLMQRDLDRIFEQVDLLRFDSWREPVPAQAAPVESRATATVAPEAGLGYAAAVEMAAHGADEAQISARCGLSAPEAHILVAMRRLQGKSGNRH